MLNSTQKRTEAEKTSDKDGKVFYKLRNSTVYSKTVEDVRNEIDLSLVSNKDYLNWALKPSYMSQKICGNGLVAIRKSKVTLIFNKPAYVGMCISDLSKVMMYKFYYDHINIKYGNKTKMIIH